MLVEDTWQGQGIGSSLADALVEQARARRLCPVHVCYLVDSTKIARLVTTRAHNLVAARTSAGVTERLLTPGPAVVGSSLTDCSDLADVAR